MVQLLLRGLLIDLLPQDRLSLVLELLDNTNESLFTLFRLRYSRSLIDRFELVKVTKDLGAESFLFVIAFLVPLSEPIGKIHLLVFPLF